MYRYRAQVVSVYDGDTIRCDIDLGFGIWMRDPTIRLYGINTPELRGDDKEAGLAARDWLREKVLGFDIQILTHKDKKGKYGRWLGTLFDGGISINQEMIDRGYAVPYLLD